MQLSWKKWWIDIKILIKVVFQCKRNDHLFSIFWIFDFKFSNKFNINPFIPVAAKTATSQVDLQVWKG